VEAVTAEELLDDPESKPCPLCGTHWETVTACWDEANGRYRVRAIPAGWNRGSPSSQRAGSAVGFVEQRR
jgi:hypothetical protein